MNRNEQIQHVELSLEDAKKVAALGEAIKRLEKNRDFQKVVFDCFFTEEAKRLTFLTADTTLDEKKAAAVWQDIRAIGSFRAFLMARKTLGEMATKEINDHLEALDELRAEEGDAE